MKNPKTFQQMGKASKQRCSAWFMGARAKQFLRDKPENPASDTSAVLVVLLEKNVMVQHRAVRGATLPMKPRAP